MPEPRFSEVVYPWVSPARLVQTLMLRLRLHPLIVNPPVRDFDGNPIRINRIRAFDGPEVKNFGGITLSIFPFHFSNADQSSLTANTQNASVVYKPSTLQGPDGHHGLTNLDAARANLVLKLSIGGFSQEPVEDTTSMPGSKLTLEYSLPEMLLQQYMPLLRMILCDDLRHLPRFPDKKPLVSQSFVHHEDYPTADWTKGANAVLHSAMLLWQVDYYCPRRWRQPAYYTTFPEHEREGVLIVGEYAPDGPGGSTIGVLYDTMVGKVIDADSGASIDLADLIDPGTGRPWVGLDPDLVELLQSVSDPNVPGALPSLFFKRVAPTWEKQ